MSKQKNNTALKFLFIAFVLFFVSMAGYEYFQYGSIFNNSEHYRKIYAEALELKNNEEFQQAFLKLENISPRYEAYDAVIYQQAQCAAKAGDEATVQKRLKSLISKYPQSYLFIPSKYDLAKSYLRSGDKNSAADIFQNIINSHGGTDFETGSYYYLAELSTEKDLALSIKYWKKYISQSQDGRFSTDCAERLAERKAILTEDENLFMGLVYLNAKNYDKALSYFEKSPKEKVWFYLARLNIEKNRPLQAKEYIKKGLKEFIDVYTKEELEDLLYSYVNLYSSQSVIWQELYQLKQPKIEDIVLFNSAKYLQDLQAQKLYLRIVDVYFKGSYSSEALKKLFWIAYKRGNYTAAKDYALKHINNFENTKSAPEMNFWVGKIYEKEKNKDAALKAYNKVLLKYPDDYYAFRSYGRVLALTGGKDFGWNMGYDSPINQEKFELELPYSYSEIKTKFGSTLAELLLVQDFTTIEYFYGFEEPFIESWIYYKKGLRSTATTMARNAMEEYSDKPDKTDKKWNFVYPCYFMEEINKYSVRNKISPYLMIALIREESYFNPLALSASNAVGLSQILPSTAREVSERRGYGRINEFLLFNPETNIKFGSAYVSQLKKQMDGKMLLSVASYNGGAGAVSSWLKTKKYSDADEFVEIIPYEETKNYVKKVFRSYWNYLRLYSNN